MNIADCLNNRIQKTRRKITNFGANYRILIAIIHFCGFLIEFATFLLTFTDHQNVISSHNNKIKIL